VPAVFSRTAQAIQACRFSTANCFPKLIIDFTLVIQFQADRSVKRYVSTEGTW